MSIRPVLTVCFRTCLVAVLGVALVTAVPALADEIIIDNDSAGFSVLSGNWSTRDSAPGHYGADYCFALVPSLGEVYSEVEWRPTITTAGNYEVAIYYPQGTNRANNSPFTVEYQGGSQSFAVNQQANGGQWVVLGTFPFAAGTSGRLTLNNTANPSVVLADAARFTSTGSVNLTMAVQPTGAGTTMPAIGGPYARNLNEVVNIQATANTGYEFDHWEASAGSAPADPESAGTTVTMDQAKTVTAVFVPEGSDQEFRGMWVDAFGSGFKSQAEVDALISWAIAGRYNAILPEVMAFQDNAGSAHGAYWTSNIVPEATDVSAGFDPLGYLVQQAHAAGLQVHCWLVAFRVCSTWPPSGNATMSAHPEWLSVPYASAGAGPAKVGGYYTLDPGSPDAQSYLISIVHEICANYAVDGIHWDYIRYTQQDAGYPASNTYANSSLKRYQRITPYTGLPPTSGEASWDDFRRRGITELVRRCRFEIPLVRANPQQPIRFSSALVTWYPASTDFHQTRPYYDSYCDWEEWIKQGYLDTTIPMNYFDDDGSYAASYRGWVDNSVAWKYGRHTVTGPGIYMNSFANSVVQMAYARGAGADGLCTYSYRATDDDSGTTWSDWYGYVATNLFTQSADVPPMPWRDPATAADGVLYGRVFDAQTGAGVDDAGVSIGGQGAVRTDANGYYVFARLTATASGTTYQVTASSSAYAASRTRSGTALAGDVNELNIPLGTLDPGDYDGDGDIDQADFTRWSFCMVGPNHGPVISDCAVFDMDADTDVDLHDFALFQEAFTGP